MFKQFDSGSSPVEAATGNGGTRKPASRRRGPAPKSPVRITRADIAAAQKYIHRYACDGLSVERLVKETQNVSAAIFAKHFKVVTGQTPRQAIRRRQLEEAATMLARTELSTQFIAECCGFRSPIALARVFESVEGRVPREFHQRAGSIEKELNAPPLRQSANAVDKMYKQLDL